LEIVDKMKSVDEKGVVSTHPKKKTRQISFARNNSLILKIILLCTLAQIKQKLTQRFDSDKLVKKRGRKG
jgi:hypothetical protein